MGIGKHGMSLEESRAAQTSIEFHNTSSRSAKQSKPTFKKGKVKGKKAAGSNKTTGGFKGSM